jgi:uncharacterized protein YjdB
MTGKSVIALFLTVHPNVNFDTYHFTVICRDMTLEEDARQEFTLVVNRPPDQVTGIGVDRTSMTLDIGQTFELGRFIYPRSASNQDATFTSSDPSVAQVIDQNSYCGVIQGKSPGMSVITASSAQGGVHFAVSEHITSKAVSCPLARWHVTAFFNCHFVILAL